jgi:hypothetical protein
VHTTAIAGAFTFVAATRPECLQRQVKGQYFIMVIFFTSAAVRDNMLVMPASDASRHAIWKTLATRLDACIQLALLQAQTVYHSGDLRSRSAMPKSIFMKIVT